MTLTYDDHRSLDRYEVDLTPDGEFDSALRFVTGIGRDPIHYGRLADVPQPHRSEIEQRIWKLNHPEK